MNLFKKKLKIEFFSTVPGVSSVYPVIPAKNYMPNWVEKTKEHYKDFIKHNQTSRQVHIYRCPGIFDILRTGFYVTMPWDVLIETRGDPWDFKWTVPSAELSELMYPHPLVASHKELARMLPTPPGAMTTVIKLATPWQIKAPKGIKFMVLPLSYSDAWQYEHVPGILDPSDSSEVNFQVWWYETNGPYTIKAGTPIAHLIPITEEDYELVVRDANELDKLWVTKRKYLNNISFMHLRNKLKKAYWSHWNNDE